MSWLTPGPFVQPEPITQLDETPPVVGDAVLCFWYDQDACFAGLIVGEGVYDGEDANYDYFDVKRADGRILTMSPGDVRRLSDVK